MRGDFLPRAATTTRSAAFGPSFRKNFQIVPRSFQIFPRRFHGNSSLFQRFPSFFRGRFKGNQGVTGASSPALRLLQILRGLGPRDGRPGDSLPGALTIQYTANSDFRKEIGRLSRT
jgi:hypothetical protein